MPIYTVMFKILFIWGTSLLVQWLRLPTSNAGNVGSILGQGTKIPHAEAKIQKHNQKQNSKMLLFTYFQKTEETSIIPTNEKYNLHVRQL